MVVLDLLKVLVVTLTRSVENFGWNKDKSLFIFLKRLVKVVVMEFLDRIIKAVLEGLVYPLRSIFIGSFKSETYEMFGELREVALRSIVVLLNVNSGSGRMGRRCRRGGR